MPRDQYHVKSTDTEEQDRNDAAFVEALVKAGEDRAKAEGFVRFRNKDKAKEVVRNIKLRMQSLLENQFREANEKAIETQNKVLRKAWTQSCLDLQLEEDDYPCPW